MLDMEAAACRALVVAACVLCSFNFVAVLRYFARRQTGCGQQRSGGTDTTQHGKHMGDVQYTPDLAC